jgi:hypothetical protein
MYGLYGWMGEKQLIEIFDATRDMLGETNQPLINSQNKTNICVHRRAIWEGTTNTYVVMYACM